jgi:hypothetical protein
MLDVALEFLAQQLNAYRGARTGAGAGAQWVVPTRLVTDKGDSQVPANRVGVALINVEEERALRDQLPESRRVGDRHVVFEPELKLNLVLLFVASDVGGYPAALRSIADILTFFQARPVFTPERDPGLDPRITRLGVDLLTLTYEQLNQVWSFVGGKQLPSAAYRVRLVALQDEQPLGVGVPITTFEHALGSR